MTILYADDDADDCEIMAEALLQIDPSISFITASDGREALKVLDHIGNLPDTVFLDVNMPVMDGRECLRAMKDNVRFRDIPVIIYSTTNNAREMDELYRMGAHGFIHKAWNFSEVQKALHGVIARLRGGNPGTPGAA